MGDLGMGECSLRAARMARISPSSSRTLGRLPRARTWSAWNPGHIGGDFSLLWSGEAAAMARETDAEALTRQLWDDALDRAAGLRAGMAARAG